MLSSSSQPLDATEYIEHDPKAGNTRRGGAILAATTALLVIYTFASNSNTIALSVFSQPDDLVTHLPGFNGKLDRVHYAGFVTSNATMKNYLFYWFMESKSGVAPGDAPLIIWLNGGPGASSSTGLVIEGVGPLLLDSDDDGKNSLSPSPAPWTDIGHVLSFDSPVGSGYSYSENGTSGLARSLEQVAKELYEGLQAFLDLHPTYASCPLFLTGESFAGKYIPFTATYIRRMNALGSRREIKLTGMAIGNGVLKPLLQYASLLEFAPALGFADASLVNRLQPYLERCKALLAREPPLWEEGYAECQVIEDEIYGGMLPFVYDVRETSPKFDSITDMMAAYFNSEHVRKALHVGDEAPPWLQMDGGQAGNRVSDALWRGQIEDLPAGMVEELIDAFPGNVLFYTGNMDGSMCNVLGGSRVLQQLRWSGSEAYRNADRCVWHLDSKAAGSLKQGGGLAALTVINSGHLVPMSQPHAAREMIRALTAGKITSICRA